MVASMKDQLRNGVDRLNHTIPQACSILNCGTTMMYELINEVHVDRVYIGSRALITDASLRRLSEEILLIAQINRALAAKGQRVDMRLSRHRGRGRFFIVNDSNDELVDPNADLVGLARSLNVEQPRNDSHAARAAAA